jgi:hypothetical protein
LRISLVSNLLGGCFVAYLILSIRGGKFNFGCITRGNSLDGMNKLNCMRLVDILADESAL